MGKIAIVTDSNSGITQSQAKQLGIDVIPMPFDMDGETLYEDIDLQQDEFYQRLSDGTDISTSQPAIGKIIDLWNHLLKDHDGVVHIPMSSGLSGSCQAAAVMAEDFHGRVQVVDNHRISVTQRRSVVDAIQLAKAGKSAAEIKEILEEIKLESSIYILVDTLKYLKKGGRVTATAAAIGTVLNIKPVLQIQGGKLDAFAKVRGMKQAKQVMLNAVKKDMETRFADAVPTKDLWIDVAHTHNDAVAKEFAEEIKALYPGYGIHIDPLSLSVACHIGPGSLAIACTRKLPEKYLK